MKQRLRKVLVLAFVLLAIAIAYCIFKATTIEKQTINISYSSNVSTASTLESVVSVLDQNGNTKKSKVTLELFDNDGKKVKGVKEKYKLEEGEVASCSLAIPENLESGNYNLKIKATSGLLTTNKEVSINISDSSNSDIVISLDKGMYKPGDTIKYRVLLISKTDNTPKSSKEVSVEIFDGNGNKVYSENSNTTEFGIVSGDFTLAQEVNSGTYTISVDGASKKVSKTFTVSPYVVPQFAVTVNPDKEVYQVGETANVTFNAKYFFGEPVVNANVEGKINDVEFKGLTDSEGNFTYQYPMSEKGKANIEVTVIDTSNYLIEESSTIFAQETAFEVETIFENNQINKNIENVVYIVAKKIDGTPVKVHASITIGQIARQVITDENGIGKFTLTATDTASLASSSVYQISAEDNEGNAFTNQKNVDVVSNSVAISTDKVKYSQGEDIKINLSAITDSSKIIVYVCKNGEILKMISTDSDSVSVNLEDTSGLIDLFVENKKANNNYYYDDDIVYFNAYRKVLPTTSSNGFVRKTIFIKPASALDIGVSTDKEEYKPGENLTLSFKVKDENNKTPDTNLLVSILDEAVLSLADNDLSMDNIRIALKDIDLTEEISAADLYADVLSNESDSTLTLALLKHDAPNPSVKQDNSKENYADEYIEKIAVLVLSLILVLMVYASISENKKFASIIQDIINILVITVVVLALFGSDIYYDYTSNSIIKTIVAITVLILMVYCLALYKMREKVFMLIKNLLVIPGIYIGVLALLYYNLDYNENIAYCGILAVPVIMTILIVWSRTHKLNGFWNLIKELTVNLTKVGISYFVALILTDMTFDNGVCFVIFLIGIYYALDRIYKAKVLNKKSSSKKLNVGETVMVAFFIIILILLVGSFRIVRNFSSNIIADDVYVDDFDGPIMNFEGAANDIQNFKAADTSGASASEGALGIFGNIFDTATNAARAGTADLPEAIAEEDSVVENTTISEETTAVRSVFLESLAFIPNLVVENGTGSTQIKLSDNITTWNIQVVGNTKEGSIGSSSNTFKVFKEFFVDFSLPTNSVVNDKTSIPVTIYNYTEESMTVNLKVVENDWSNIGNYSQNTTVDSNSTALVYIPIEITKAGNNVLRIEASANGISDIVERTFTVTPNGYKKTNVVSSSTIDKSFSIDYFTTENAIENTRKLKVKIYPSAISQAIEGMESIFRMPTGCFEQTSSSLYPNILALKYLEDNNLDNEEIRNKALEYISTGYQRLLTFEVNGVKGGYSLFGNSPAEPVITAFGLMELTDASEVYDVDEQVIENMKNYLYSEQKSNGSFDINATLETGAASSSDLAMNAYIIWALSESDPDDSRLNSSVAYLEGKINDADDNYTLALMANVFSNVKSKKVTSAINKLLENVEENGENAYINSNIRDYYGSYGNYQAMQTTALTSMALTKNNLHSSTNNSLIKYLISNKDSFGNWGTTQATILSLKAINMNSGKGKIAGQTISVSLNGETQDIKVGNNALDIYEVEFDKIKEENSINIDMKKGSISYELVEEYYVPYETIDQDKEKYDISVDETINTNVKVNDIIKQEITLQNNTNDTIANGLITINIPQGCTVDQNFLEKCKTLGMIEKYDYNYTTLNLYIRNFKKETPKTLEVQYRTNYPEEVTGGAIRAFDYYNPNIEGIKVPTKISVTE